MKIKVKKINPQIGQSIPAPYYATDGAAAMDLHACVKKPVRLEPMAKTVIPAGIAVELPQGFMALVFARSGLGVRHGISLSNGVGVIDSDYRGEIQVGLINLSAASYTINPGDRIAQLAVVPVAHADIEFTDEIESTSRGGGGFGSTGK